MTCGLLTKKAENIVLCLFLYNENHAIVAWFSRGYADEKKSSKYGIIV